MTQFSYCTFWSLAARIQCHSPRSCGLQGVQHKAQGHGHAGMSIYNCGEESGFARRPAGTVGCEIAMQALAIDCSGGRESPVDSDGTESIIDGLDEDCLLLAKIDDRLQPVILFDWDDTLLASTDLSFYGYRIDSDERFAGPVEEALRALEASVLELLDLALESGQVYIVTNSEAGWVEMSARRFLPSVVRLLDKITVISARSIYERDFPGCPSAWKLQAFMQMTDLFRGRTVVSLGDSYVEREAIYAATSVTYDSRTVSVKFLERPSLAQLRIQIDLIKQAHLWTYLCDPETDLDLMLVTDPQASSANFIVASTV